MPIIPFYDPKKSYEENFNLGPFGIFSNTKPINQEGEPAYEIFGQNVYLPFGIPPGPLLNGKYVKAAMNMGFDIAAYKTVRTREHKSAPFPNVLAVHPQGDLTLEIASAGLVGDNEYKDPIAITNSFGVPSFDPDFWQKDMSEAVKAAGKGQFVIGGFQGTIGGTEDDFIKDFIKAAKLVKEAGAPVLEANLSCPNEGSSHLLCFDTNRTEKIIKSIKDEIGNTPLIIKIAYFSDQSLLEDLLNRIGRVVDGISAINTIPTKIWKNDDKKDAALPGENRLVSGVCGAPIKWAGIDMVQRLENLRKQNNYKFLIMGVGGVTTPDDYSDYRSAGADVVMSATGSMWNPLLAQEIKNLA